MARGAIFDGGMLRPVRAGDVQDWNPVVAAIATDANGTLTIAQILNGIVQYTGFTAGRTITTDTAANILASNQFLAMDVGDSLNFTVSVIPAFALTWAAGTGVTLAGRATVPASSSGDVIITKNSATTVTFNVL